MQWKAIIGGGAAALGTLGCGPKAPVKVARPAAEIVAEILFEDHFGPRSRGELVENLVQHPPPKGLGYTTPYPQGHQPTRWTLVDARPPEDPLRGFWIVAPEGDYLVQAGRSASSFLFANDPVPEDVVDYDIELRQHRGDNDPIAFVLGARRLAVDHGGVEVTHETQRPGSDETTADLYVHGPLGSRVVAGAAGMYAWRHHKIEVRGSRVRWLQDGEEIAAATVANLPRGGRFGLGHRYDRNTRYDDVRIVALRREGGGPAERR